MTVFTSLQRRAAHFMFASACYLMTAQNLEAQPPAPLSSTFTATDKGTRAAMLPTLYANSHAANLLVRKNGDVLCFWFSGTHEGDSNVAIVVSRLPKGTNRWEPAVLVDREPGKSYQNPVPYEDPKGRIWLWHTSQTAGKGQADSQVLKVFSDDGGNIWSKQEVLFQKAGSYLRQPTVVGENGDLLLPIYYSTSEGITKGAETNYSAVQVSKDFGKTWKECLVPKSDGMVQMNIVKLKQKSYVAFYRSRFADHIYRSTSTDGCSWTAPQATVLPSNNASIQAFLLKSGQLVMTFDNTRGKSEEHKTQTGPRAPLSIALSPDAGITWNAVRDLELPDAPTAKPEGREEYSYPSVLQMPDGNILTAYTFRRLAIKAVLVSEPWIKGGTTVGVYKP
ncbi:exo-alpha-sialidase [soil metagenome]